MSDISRTGGRQPSDWIETFAAKFEAQEGMPLIAGRILGFLLICDPPERTAAELSAALSASSGSVSTNVRLLMARGLVSKTTRRGREAAVYQVRAEAWAEVMLQRLEAIAAVNELTHEGLRLLSGQGDRAQRLRIVDAYYRWLATEVAELPAKWSAAKPR
ncbi:MarR family transcriptional regulator [Crossiella sp. SN42]|uniref:MarR family transcriptional regulator n=1 Tax=Crossiella sp. SN42 TaxID=2944808 RepID=UPI00207C53DD|nr:MarR family transcriptional regulator [Crossiella sp. SN42]MCO1577571.1 MarR family transcriptional regulator [Crossiella sp. SN42]